MTKAIKPSEAVTSDRRYDGAAQERDIPHRCLALNRAREKLMRAGEAAQRATQLRGSSSPAKKRGVTSGIRRQLRRRSAVEPVIGHHDLWFSQGDASNTILAAAGYNFRCLIWWLRLLLRQIFFALTAALERVPV
jgi:hypothetical protein